MIKIYIDQHMTNWFSIMIVEDDKPIASDHVFGLTDLKKTVDSFQTELSKFGKEIIIKRSDSVEEYATREE